MHANHIVKPLKLSDKHNLRHDATIMHRLKPYHDLVLAILHANHTRFVARLLSDNFRQLNHVKNYRANERYFIIRRNIIRSDVNPSK